MALRVVTMWCDGGNYITVQRALATFRALFVHAVKFVEQQSKSSIPTVYLLSLLLEHLHNTK
jgi:hypothetical protein